MKPDSLPRRVSGIFRLIADFIVVILIGALWVPLQMSQQRTIESDAAETEEKIEHSKREGKRTTV